MSQVIISDVIPRTQIVATASQTVFSTTWTADQASDINVYQRAAGVPASDATQLLSNTLYTVAFIGGTQIVQVTLNTGATSGDIITIIRNTPADRDNLYLNTNFTPSMLNQDFGILTLVDQQAQMYDKAVTPHYNLSDTITPNDLVLPVLGNNTFWFKNNAGIIETFDLPLPNGLAPADATYILNTPNDDLENAQSLSALATGILKSTTTTGILSISAVLTAIDAAGVAANVITWMATPSSANLLAALTTKSGTGLSVFNTAPTLENPVVADTSDPTKNVAFSLSGMTTAKTATLLFDNTLARTYTFPDATGTLALTGSTVASLSFGTTGLTPNSATTGVVTVAGTLISTNGGTGVSNPTAHGIMIAEGASAMTPIVLAAGQVLVGTTASDPTAATIGSGTGITVTSSTGAISIALAAITGSGASVLASGATATNLTLITPALGTPTSGVLSSCTGYAAASLTGLGTNVATGLATTLNGTGALAGTTSPTFVTPTLGVATATSLAFSPSTGGIVGTATNNNAGAGYVGEFVSSVIPQASPVTITVSGTVTDVTSIALTAGDWDVWGNIFYLPSVACSAEVGWTNTASATQPNAEFIAQFQGALNNQGFCVPYRRVSAAGNVTCYLTANATFASGNCQVSGGIYARRVR